MICGQVPVRQLLVHDTWAARDLPVLDATVGLLEQSYMVTVTDIAARTKLDPSVVAKALEALDPVYVDFRKTTTGGDPRFWYVFKVTPEARRAVGQWPTAEALASRLAAELTAAAQQETDGERQGLLAYAARLVGDTLRAATVRAAGEVLAPAFGGTPLPEMGQPVPEPEPQQEPDFPSLVPLPELPELLRPERPGPAAVQAPEPASERSPEPASERAPEPVDEQSPEPAEAARLEPAAEIAELNPWPEPDPVVSDLNPWPEPAQAAEPEASAQELTPLPAPSPFRSSLAAARPAATVSGSPGYAGQSDPDAADTDMDLVESRGDAASG
jgi:predicted transcriptional regulator